MHVGYTFTQGGLFNIPKGWFLVDTYSTCDLSNNPKLVTNIRVCKPEDSLIAYTNGGAQTYQHIADLLLLPITVCFKKNSMATILSFESVSEIPGARITMDTAVNKSITLTLKDKQVLIFEQYKNVLFFLTQITLNLKMT